MQEEVDDGFFERADAHINLSNDQISDNISKQEVSASFMFSVARFNAYVSACGFASAAEMQDAKNETMEYFTEEFRKVLAENLEDYISNFNSYMQVKDSVELE